MAQHTTGQNRGGTFSRPPHPGPRPPQQAARIDASRIVFAKEIDAKLYSDIAEECAKAVAGERGTRNPRNKPAQLRRFYDELVALQDKVRDGQQRFDEHRPFIQMLKAKVAYAKGRDKVDDEFVSLLNRIVDQARDCSTLKQARLFMEAFMAFYKVHGPRD
jgi:CRISPR-associated protein Csm2